MADEPLLSDLCKICTNNTPKYCCPRCNAKTCSLPCYKRHKLWAQCSGKRDPTAYVPRGQLTTPAGIDHDYNFLTGIERSLDAADRRVEQRGISLDVGNDTSYRPNPGSNLGKALVESGALVHRAPKGMSRQKNNNTLYHSRGNRLVWTVEWVHAEGTRELTSCREDIPLVEAYILRTSQGKALKEEVSKGEVSKGAALKEKASKFEVSHEKPPKTRKRKRAVPKLDSVDGEPVPIAEVKTDSVVSTSNIDCYSNDVIVTSDISAQSESTTSGQQETTLDALDKLLTDGNEPVRTVIKTEAEGDVVTSSPIATDALASTAAVPFDAGLYFYLHKPLTPTRTTILIPLPPNITLRQCLRGRIVLEYPTIYATNYAPEDLPDNFRLESELPRMIQELEDEAADDELFAASSEAASRNGLQGHVKREEDGWEDRKVLESLRKDIEAAARGQS